ncbi:response regulator [Azonexus sp.]|uniref:response regulator n=1 Tax=Azonexus sp. TaxID=1872668 RepID=UPI0039E5A248
MTFRLLLVDDHQMFREALHLLLERNPRLEIVGESGDGHEALALARSLKPDVICLDIDLPGINGIEITRRLKNELPQCRVIALSIFADRGYISDMLAAGALSYVTKAAASTELLRAIDAVCLNRSYLCPETTQAIRDVLGDGHKLAASKLGGRETEVLRLVASGLTSGQIAEKLGIAQSTVDVHRRNIMRKLRIDSAVGLTHYAIRHRLVPSV